MDKNYSALFTFLALLLFSVIQLGNAQPPADLTPEATPQVDIIVTPEDDPLSTRCEIEIVGQSHANTLYRVLVRVRTPVTFDSSGDASSYITNCTLIGFQKLGYTLWHHSRIEVILHDDDGDYYAWGIFNDIN